MSRSALSLLLVASVSAVLLSGCSTGATAPSVSPKSQSAIPSWIGTATPDPAPPLDEFEALIPAIRERARIRSWGPRTLPQGISVGTPVALHSYTETAAATFWGGVEPTVTGYAVPVLDSNRQTVAVVLLSVEPSSTGPAPIPVPATTESTGRWTIHDVGYLKWEGLPQSGALYSEVASMVAQERAVLGPDAVIQVAVNDGAAAILGTSGSTAAFAYARGQGPHGSIRLPGLQPGRIVTGAAALRAARAMARRPARQAHF